MRRIGRGEKLEDEDSSYKKGGGVLQKEVEAAGLWLPGVNDDDDIFS